MKPGYVYFITFEDEEFRSKIPAIKIGSTYDIDKRMKSLSTGSPMPLMLIGFLVHKSHSHLEAKLQYEFRRFRMKGEWFMASPELLENIKKLDPKFNILDDLFQETEEDARANFLVQDSLGRRGSGFLPLQRREERAPLLSLSSKIRLMIVS